MKSGDSAELRASSTNSDLELDAVTRRLPLPTSNHTANAKPLKGPKWNTSNLGLRLAADAASAASAAVLVAPIISILDRSVMEMASKRNTIANSIKNSLKNLVLRPQAIFFSKPFALILMVYGGTYLTANTVDTAASTMQNKPATKVTSGTAKFAASSAANVSLSIYKDQIFVKLFGPRGVVPRPVPLASYLLFTARDCMTIFASFNVPPLLGPYIHSRMGKEMQKRISGLSAAQFLAPACVQLFSTPVHLLGLDFYNRPGCQAVVPLKDRWAAVRKNWAITATARIGRIVPAFGIGGVVNYKVRRNLMERLT